MPPRPSSRSRRYRSRRASASCGGMSVTMFRLGVVEYAPSLWEPPARSGAGVVRRVRRCQVHDEQRVIRQPPLPNLMIVAAAGHARGEDRRGKGVVDPEPPPRATASGSAEPGVFLGVPVLAPPEIHESDPGELGERPPGLEAVVPGIDAGRAGVEVAQHEEGPSGAAGQPAGGGGPERGKRGTGGRTIDRAEAHSASDKVQLEPA